MEISFSSNKLEKIFNSEKLLKKNYGKNAEKIMIRMAVLVGAKNLSEIPNVPPDRCHELSGNRKGQFAVDLMHPFRLIFIPDQEPLPKKEDGGIDLKKIDKIKILEVEDYH